MAAFFRGIGGSVRRAVPAPSSALLPPNNAGGDGEGVR